MFFSQPYIVENCTVQQVHELLHCAISTVLINKEENTKTLKSYSPLGWDGGCLSVVTRKFFSRHWRFCVSKIATNQARRHYHHCLNQENKILLPAKVIKQRTTTGITPRRREAKLHFVKFISNCAVKVMCLRLKILGTCWKVDLLRKPECYIWLFL